MTPAPRLTIGQAAAYAGLTARAVRHYHQLGLIDEPPRDSSGYRRYSARDVIDLIRIRALAHAGVPLNRIGELLTADPDELAEAVAEIDDQLRAEIRRLEGHRVAIAQLATVDGLALPAEVVDYLDMLRGLGLSERSVTIERDAWLLVAAQIPDQIVEWIALKRASFDDPQIVAMYQALDAAYDLEPGDPRLEHLADELSSLFRSFADKARADGDESRDEPIDDNVTALLDAESVGRSPGWRHLGKLLEQRGWIGWTNIEPQQPDG
jgi:DNA-binding transcriptional MerR regulator